MMHPVCPQMPVDISADERLGEIADILASGLIRLQARKSSELSRACSESSLDCVARQSSHAAENSPEHGA
jgi:hypothetical protein